MEETFDVVDRSDREISTASREEVHRERLLHRSTHLLVFDENGRVLLQKRSEGKDSFPGRWDSSVSGHVDAGEEYDECVVRETFEEIGLYLENVPERMFKIDACEETGNEFTWAYRHNYDGPFVVNDEEISELRWFHREEVDRMLLEDEGVFSPSFTIVWRRLKTLNEDFVFRH